MIEPAAPSERTPPVSPQLAWRVAIMGGIALALFAIIFFRLWYLQVLSGTQYRAEATANPTRILPIAAPRGEILDRNGVVLATDHTTYAVQLVPGHMPPEGEARITLYKRLGRLLHIHWRTIQAIFFQGEAAGPAYANITIAENTGYGVLTRLEEHQLDYPGVTETEIAQRNYPFDELAGQILGYVRPIDQQELKSKAYGPYVKAGDIVGQGGLEAQYNSFLQGRDGSERVQVNAAGDYEGTESSIAPTAGYDLRTTLDYGLEAEGYRAMAEGEALAQANGNPGGPGAFVAINPFNGDVYAMGSLPTFNSNAASQPYVSDAEYNQLFNGANAPDINRALVGEYPTGSTFKPISAMAGLEAGLITPFTTMGAGGCVTISLEQFCNSGHVNDGDDDLVEALTVSEDTYFYELGAEANPSGNEEGVIQKMAYYLGLGNPTGVDLPGEYGGIVPTIAWLNKQNALNAKCRCGLTAGEPWTVGQNVQFATGQGALEATPLQMAVVYSTLANTYANGDGNGVVPVPHLATEVDEPTGQLVQVISPPKPRHVHLNPTDLGYVMEGLHDATSAPGGTSADVWAGFPHIVYGKTGTAEHSNGSGGYTADQSWYVCYLPDPHKPIVIAVTIQGGGFGDQAAAPVARLMASEWFGEAEKVVRGTSPTF